MKHTLHFLSSFKKFAGAFFCGLFFLLFSLGISAQTKNLVINPSFENYTYPPIVNWPSATNPGEEIVPGWVTPTRGTADYYNSDISTCDGFPIAKARTGQGRCAMILGLYSQLNNTTNYKEYVQGKFSQPLEAGKKYCVKFYLALDRGSPNTTTGIGAYISPDAIRSDDKEPLPCKPQIFTEKIISAEDGWTEISGVYTANGGEQYITIGSFSETSVIRLDDIGKSAQRPYTSDHIMRSAYFYIDDVSVMIDDGKMCDCTIKKDPEATGDYFLFLLDVSGSMSKSGNLDELKKDIIHFSHELNGNNRIGVMSFSGQTKMLLPFSSPVDSEMIDSTINHLKAMGVTNGDHAIYRVSEMIDSMHLPQRCHVIIATDGIFHVTTKTKAFADSVLTKNNTSFVALQFGNGTNDDLMEITQSTPQGNYLYANKHNVPKLIEEQVPPPEKAPNEVHYTDMGKATGNQILEDIIIPH
jgi:uncharacterized protein YegL